MIDVRFDIGIDLFIIALALSPLAVLLVVVFIIDAWRDLRFQKRYGEATIEYEMAVGNFRNRCANAVEITVIIYVIARAMQPMTVAIVAVGLIIGVANLIDGQRRRRRVTAMYREEVAHNAP